MVVNRRGDARIGAISACFPEPIGEGASERWGKMLVEIRMAAE